MMPDSHERWVHIFTSTVFIWTGVYGTVTNRSSHSLFRRSSVFALNSLSLGWSFVKLSDLKKTYVLIFDIMLRATTSQCELCTLKKSVWLFLGCTLNTFVNCLIAFHHPSRFMCPLLVTFTIQLSDMLYIKYTLSVVDWCTPTGDKVLYVCPHKNKSVH